MQFLDILEQRLHDVSAYVRSHVLRVHDPRFGWHRKSENLNPALVHGVQLWGDLNESGAIPLSRRASVVGVVAGRLDDKSAYVRKQVCLFCALMLFFARVACPVSIIY